MPMRQAWSVRFAAILTVMMGCVNLLSSTRPAFAERLEILLRYLPLEVQHGSRLSASLAGVALVLLGNSLRRRKHVAWFLTVILLLFSALGHLLKGLDYEEAAIALTLAIFLLLLRPHFHARSDRPSVVQGMRVLVSSLTLTLAYGVTGFYLLDYHFKVNFDFLSALRETLVLFSQFHDPGLQPVTAFGRHFVSSVYFIAVTSFGYALFMLTRPVPDEKACYRIGTETCQNHCRGSWPFSTGLLYAAGR